jgi:hypothetical protein
MVGLLVTSDLDAVLAQEPVDEVFITFPRTGTAA